MMDQPQPSRLDRHPDLGELEAVRSGEVSGEVRRHVESCPSCREALAELADVAGAFERVRSEAVGAPEAADRAVLAEIGRTADRIARRAGLLRLIRRSLYAATSAAAVAVLCVGLWRLVGPDDAADLSPAEAPVALRPGDVDGNGRVDVVDAYLMAKRLEAHRPAPDSWDLNHDGAVDLADVEAVARLAVTLNGEDA